MSKIIEAIPMPPLYYHATETSYWREDGNNRWIKINETSAKSFTADNGYSKVAGVTGSNSEVDRCLMKIQSRHNVVYVGPLAGYAAGVQEMGSNLVLVTSGPQLIAASPGNWPVLEQLLAGLFLDGELDQRPYFYGWLKSARDSLKHSRWKASQLLAMAGPPGSGKSLLQNLITEMLGRRSTKPYQFMMGQTAFNSHMFRGEHQMLEDENESIDIRSRRQFAGNIKTILTNMNQNCHAKNREALTLQPIWRMTLSLNDDPERLLVLPPFDSDVRDKIIVLKVNKAPMPMPTTSSEEEAAFWRQLVSELPAFLHFIEAYQVPPALQDSRYGIAAFQHPEIVDKVQETTPENKLLELIDTKVWPDALHRDKWEGSAAELKRRLMREGSETRDEARDLLRWNNATGTYLARLRESADQRSGRVASRKVNGTTIWTIQPPSRLAEAPVVSVSRPCQIPPMPAEVLAPLK